MDNHWEMFPGAVAVIDGTHHAIERPQTESSDMCATLRQKGERVW